MRIAMVAHTSASWTPHYARRFGERGHVVRVLSFSPDPLPGADVIHMKGARPRILPKPLWFLSQVPRLRRRLKEFRPDVVLATYVTSNGMSAALAWRGPLVVSARGSDVLAPAPNRPGGSLHRSMLRFVCGRATLVHAVSEELAEALVRCGVPADRIARFPLGVDLETFSLRPGTPAGGGPVRIVCTRRQEPVYANHLLLEALASLRASGAGFHCTMVGGGPLLEERRAQARALGIADAVVFTGQLPLEQVRARLLSADVYVSASLRDGTSSSLLEAMACGLLPVVSRIRANETWVHGGRTGLLFEPGDAAGLARALQTAAGDATLRRDAAAANRALVEAEGDQRRAMTRMLELLERAAAGGAAGAPLTARRGTAPSSSGSRSREAGSRSGSGRGAPG